MSLFLSVVAYVVALGAAWAIGFLQGGDAARQNMNIDRMRAGLGPEASE